MMIAGALAGIGVCLLPLFAAAEGSRLVRVLPSVILERDVWACTHPDLRNVPQVRAVLDGLKEKLPLAMSCQ